jgi:hypothetical protein
MKRWTPEALSDHRLEGEEELHAWGHDFNAGNTLENNQGHSDYILQCPQGVTGCCGNFTTRRSYPHFVPSRRSHRYNPKSLKRKAHHEN